VRLFNNDSGWEFYGEDHLKFRGTVRSYQKLICEWVYERNMSEKDKKDYPSYKTTGGFLKVNSSVRKDKPVKEEDAKYFRSLPNFDAEILKKCTGIDLADQRKTIVIDGKEIKISKESYDELKRSLN
jgi:hypothetical protein